ncbi:MAG TPA: PPOX class F420-dependent oxidoreductase [Candidatus Binatus sp.]|nr:PPOX class F420-dependent oxidoreductase [Candidatus Binatus sp.]
MVEDKLAQFRNKKYINLETYRKNGEAVRTPVWFIDEDGELFVRTDYDTGKVKRIRRSPKVRFALCNMRGSVKGEWFEATARLTDDETAERIRGEIKKKYPVMFRLTELLGKGTSKVVVIQIRPSRS